MGEVTIFEIIILVALKSGLAGISFNLHINQLFVQIMHVSSTHVIVHCMFFVVTKAYYPVHLGTCLLKRVYMVSLED